MTSIIGAVVLIAATVLPVAAYGPNNYGEWGAPTAVAEVNTAAHEGCPIESPNGKQLFIASTRAGGFGKNDIWVAERANTKVPFGPMQNLGSAINSADQEFCPTPLGGGWLLFVSDRAACGATPGMTMAWSSRFVKPASVSSHLAISFDDHPRCLPPWTSTCL